MKCKRTLTVGNSGLNKVKLNPPQYNQQVEVFIEFKAFFFLLDILLHSTVIISVEEHFQHLDALEILDFAITSEMFRTQWDLPCSCDCIFFFSGSSSESLSLPSFLQHK